MEKRSSDIYVSDDLFARYHGGGMPAEGNSLTRSFAADNHAKAVNNAAVKLALSPDDFNELPSGIKANTLSAIRRYPEDFSPQIVQAFNRLAQLEINKG